MRTNKIHNYWIEQGKGEEYLNKSVAFFKSKLCKGNIFSNQKEFPGTSHNLIVLSQLLETNFVLFEFNAKYETKWLWPWKDFKGFPN